MPLRDHLWYGLTRGTNLPLSLACTNPFPIATDQVALELQAPAYATPAFVNATGNGANKWKTLDYAGLANAYAQGLALQSSFSNINTDNPDLGAFRDVGGKVLTYHGLAHDSTFSTSASIDPGSNANVSTTKVPLPQYLNGRDELFTALRNWVENGVAPTRIDVSISDASVSLPLCLYPQKATYSGTGSVKASSSYSCQ